VGSGSGSCTAVAAREQAAAARERTGAVGLIDAGGDDVVDDGGGVERLKHWISSAVEWFLRHPIYV
jgi:hypothetical protein